MSALTSVLKTRLPVSTANEVGPQRKRQELVLDLFSFGSDDLCLFSQLIVVGGATITVSDVSATNGLIHIIDQVRGGSGRGGGGKRQQGALWYGLIRFPVCPGAGSGSEAERRPAGNTGFQRQLLTLQAVPAGRKRLW